MSSDNISGVSAKNIALKMFLLPGIVWQWLLYVGFIESKGSYSAVRNRTRISRSPFMAWLFSIIVWALLAYLGYLYFQENPISDLFNLSNE